MRIRFFPSAEAEIPYAIRETVKKSAAVSRGASHHSPFTIHHSPSTYLKSAYFEMT